MNLLPFFPFTVKLLERSKGYPLVFQINFKGKALQQKKHPPAKRLPMTVTQSSLFQLKLTLTCIHYGYVFK